jgi:hypothetical protein
MTEYPPVIADGERTSLLLRLALKEKEIATLRSALAIAEEGIREEERRRGLHFTRAEKAEAECERLRSRVMEWSENAALLETEKRELDVIFNPPMGGEG